MSQRGFKQCERIQASFTKAAVIYHSPRLRTQYRVEQGDVISQTVEEEGTEEAQVVSYRGKTAHGSSPQRLSSSQCRQVSHVIMYTGHVVIKSRDRVT